MEEIFANRESEAGGEGHHEEGQGEIDREAVAVLETIVFPAGEGYFSSVPRGVGGGDESENDDRHQQRQRRGGFCGEEDDGEDEECGERGEMKKAAS